MMTALQEDVLRGAALLDKRKPGWAALVDIDVLNMSRCGFCVLGQVYGSYFEGIDELDVRGMLFGFMGMDFPMLTALWRKEILARRTHDSIQEVPPSP